MADEIIHTIPLRKKWLKVPRYKRTQKAIKTIREYAKKHSKKDIIKIGRYLNLRIWENGMKNPPHKIMTKIIKKEDHAIVELPDVKIEEEKEEVKKGVAEKIKEKIMGKETKVEEKKKQVTLEKAEKELDEKLKPKETQSEKVKDLKEEEKIKEAIYPRTHKTKNE